MRTYLNLREPEEALMNHTTSQLAALRGEAVGGIPFAPRLDLWYIANRARGTLPPSLRDLDLPRLARALGVTCHAFKADLTLPRPPEDYALLGFGLENHEHFPFRFVWDDLNLRYTADAGRMITTVATPAGELRVEMKYTEPMLRDGISMPLVNRYPLQTAADIEALCHVFDRIQVLPTPEGFHRFANHVGDTGRPIASGMPAASPMHLILHNLTAMDTFWFLYVDEREALERLATAIDRVYRATLEATLACAAKVFYWGSNYDQRVTHPPFFKTALLPWLTHAAEQAHAADKLLLTHADGDNGPLLELFAAARVDVLESVCTEPMIPIRMDALRQRTGEHCALWGGIPSVVLLPDQYTDTAFNRFLDDFFAQLGDGRKLVLGVSDNVPPDADLGRLETIQARCQSFSVGS